MNGKLPVYLGGLVLLVASGFAHAVTVSGTSVDFTFDAQTLRLYGSYSVDGDTLKFDPTDFAASISGRDDLATVAATAPQIVVTPKPGKTLGAVAFNESGSYQFVGAGGVFVTASVTLDGQGTEILKFEKENNDGFDADAWSLEQTFSLSPASSATIKIDNVLIAAVFEDLGFSRITKTAVQIQASTVPVPAAVWLLGSALFGLAGFARESRRT